MTDIDKRNYNADQFDWSGEEDIVADQAAVYDAEHLIREALQATAPVGDTWLKPSAVDNDRARIVYNVPYALADEQKQHMEELVGDIRTITYNAREYHDHPLSHCLTEISEDLVVRKFANEPFVSVWGNSSRHRRLGHTGAKVVSNRAVPHDWFRNRGMEEVTTEINSFVQGRGHLQYRLFLATHALYYMSLDDVANWLGANPNAEFHAIVHRHNKSSGKLHKGDLSYTVDNDGMVTQSNPLTGFKYSHRTLEPLFHTDSCRVLNDTTGLAWDINKLAGDNFHIKFVLCDVTAARRVVDPWSMIKTDREVYIRGDVTVYRCLSMEWFVYHGSNGQVLLEDVDLYDRLRRTIAGKERTPRARADLMAMCRRLANKNDIVSIHQGYTHEVPPGMMTDYVNAAFHADIKHELEVALLYHRENKKAVDALNRYIADGVAPADLTIVANIGRAVATPFHVLTGLLKDHSQVVDQNLVNHAMPASNALQVPPAFPAVVGRPDTPALSSLAACLAKG